ncbi:MAG: UDP-N-acetylmuramoyl-L-alanine--D-glutamate ligase [Wujia sp.]
MTKKYLVAGAGKSGICATNQLLRNNEQVILFDENPKGTLTEEAVRKKLGEIVNKENLSIHLGALTDEVLQDISCMVISPGIAVDAAFVLKVKEAGIPVWSEIELAYRYEKGSVAAITGTNGKTTTTTLVGEIMKAYNEKTFVVGNIGIPYTSLSDQSSADSVTVAEISSFQLETIVTFRPHVSALLNLTPDHLNRHYTFENYANCKLDITKNQTEDDYAVFNYDDEETRKLADRVPAKLIFFSHKEELEEGVILKDGKVFIRENGEETYVMSREEFRLLGDHNVENLLAAVAISYYMGVDIETIRKVCADFKGVEHRIEYVRSVNDVDYYNDSKGTNPDAAIKAVQSMNRPTFLIGGGYDKKSTYDEWIESFDGKVKKLLLIGQTAQDIAECARKHGFDKIEFFDSLQDVVTYCHAHAEPGDAVLLSPACASWGMFDNYEQRGDMFKEYVNAL